MWIDDQILKEAAQPVTIQCFIPKETCVVLGNSNQADLECFVDQCAAENIPIYRRYGGGGTVVLHPGCVVVSIGIWVRDFYENRKYFCRINHALIETLGSSWPKFSQLGTRGLSDISFNNQKVAGTSLFRSRNFLLYQASLLIDLDLPLIERTLRHPSREPDYRVGKSHREFLTSLNELVPEVTPTGALALLQLRLEGRLKEELQDLHTDPVQDQIPYLLARAARQ